MKFFTFIFALYILALTAMPCGDLHQNEGLTKAQPQRTEQEHQNHKSDCNDFCSSFCICNCCHSITNLYFLANTDFNIKSSLVINIPKISIYNFFFISNFFGNIWQPPKINA